MPTAENLTPESRFIALFVGPKHSGKTCAACSWLSEDPKKRLKVEDFDGRIRGLLGASWIDRKRIDYDYFPPKTIGNDKVFFERVNSDLDALFLDISNRKSPYETLVCDSLTFFARNLILDAIPLTHAQGKGTKIGTMEIAGPQDYNFEITGTGGLMAYLKSLPINIICTAHIEDKWDKPRDDKNERMQYADSIIVGEKLSLRPKVENAVAGTFDHIFRFHRKVVGGREKFFVEYISDIACTSFKGLNPGIFDITGRNFREFTLDLVKKADAENQIK